MIDLRSPEVIAAEEAVKAAIPTEKPKRTRKPRITDVEVGNIDRTLKTKKPRKAPVRMFKGYALIRTDAPEASVVSSTYPLPDDTTSSNIIKRVKNSVVPDGKYIVVMLGPTVAKKSVEVQPKQETIWG